MTSRRHLLPGLPQDRDEFRLFVLLREVGEVRLQKDQAYHVLESLGVGIPLQVFLAEERLDAGDGLLVVADPAEDLASLLRMKPCQGLYL